MRKEIVPAVFLVLVLSLIPALAGQAPRADLVILGGKVFTADETHPWVQAVAVKDGKILAVGTTADIRGYVGPATQTLDVGGRLVLPGFYDAHTHFAAGGRSLTDLTFRGVDSVAKVQEMVAAKIKELPPGAPVWGSQYDHSLFPGGRWPTRQDLDKVSPANPVVIERVDGHSVWVNSLALEQSAITRDTPNPFGGEILKDQETGEPTGILAEAAVSLLKVKRSRPSSSAEEDILRGLDHARRLGLTSIATSSTPGEIEVYRKLEREGRLTLRVYAWLPVEGLDSYIRHGIRQGQGDGLVRVGFLKMFIDGTLGSGTALMLAPFTDEPTKSGLPQYPYPKFAELVDKALGNGYQIGVHAIGDKGVRWVLDAVEAAWKKHGRRDLRPRIEHAQVVSPEDVPRFAELGVIASMQPTHCTTDMRFCERRIGPERSKNAYAWRTLLDHGARLAFGTDWPVEPLDPMRGLYSAVTRRSIEFGTPEGGWFPEQCLTMPEAVRLYTAGSAFASFEENSKGRLAPGLWADLVVLSQDIFTVEPRQVLRTEVLWTILGGRVVYHRGAGGR
jgi:predicted amidohydrolase YtcJ